jgi:hypothetical protein
MQSIDSCLAFSSSLLKQLKFLKTKLFFFIRTPFPAEGQDTPSSRAFNHKNDLVEVTSALGFVGSAGGTEVIQLVGVDVHGERSRAV